MEDGGRRFLILGISEGDLEVRMDGYEKVGLLTSALSRRQNREQEGEVRRAQEEGAQDGGRRVRRTDLDEHFEARCGEA
jgi:hypothetical protein